CSRWIEWRFCSFCCRWRSNFFYRFRHWRLYPSTGSIRSEEHTSELQSRFDLVCRLLLEKKKSPIINTASKYCKNTTCPSNLTKDTPMFLSPLNSISTTHNQNAYYSSFT